MVEPGKKPTRGIAATSAGGVGHRGEIRHDRMNGKMRKIAAQPRRVLLQEISGDVDRNIGLDARRGAQQNARLAARPAAEFDQRRAGRKQRRDGRRMFVQKPSSLRVG